MNAENRPRLPTARKPRRSLAIVATALVASLGAAVPAWALWSHTQTTALDTVELGTVVFAAKGVDDPVRTASRNGEPVTIEIDGEQISALFDKWEKSGINNMPTYKILVDGWADGANGLDYRLDAEMTGPAVAVFDRPLSNGECAPRVSWYLDDGQAYFPGNFNAKPFEFQSIGKQGHSDRYGSDAWCIAFPVHAGYYANLAKISGHWIDNNTLLQVGDQAYWSTSLVRTADTVKTAHLTITLTPILKGK